MDEFLKIEYERLNAEAEKDVDDKLWNAYVHTSMYNSSNDSFDEWKKKILSADTKASKKSDMDLDNKGIANIIDNLFSKSSPTGEVKTNGN